ncbi:hemopexin repeat-containing protein [Streptomyces sp. bgisy084]|uniref:hemopexin repeat-containing protein n=1 Tax=unclassified Streptomyces TaxID=2593676 RepID=UPI003D70F892
MGNHQEWKPSRRSIATSIAVVAATALVGGSRLIDSAGRQGTLNAGSLQLANDPESNGYPNVVWRVDTRSPEEIWGSDGQGPGFQPHGTNRNFLQHVTRTNAAGERVVDSAYVSTTTSREWAERTHIRNLLAADNGLTVWLYRIRADSNFYGVNNSLRAAISATENEDTLDILSDTDARYRRQNEWAARGGIPVANIQGAIPYTHSLNDDGFSVGTEQTSSHYIASATVANSDTLSMDVEGRTRNSVVRMASVLGALIGIGFCVPTARSRRSTDTTAESGEYQFHDIPISSRSFHLGISAAVVKDRRDIWFMRGNQSVVYNVQHDTLVKDPSPIYRTFPGLIGTRFDNQIDAALIKESATDEAWFFCGDQYVRYNHATNQIVSGPRSIRDGWTGLQGTSFVNGIDAAFPLDGSDLVYLFRGDQCIRYDPLTDASDPVRSIGEAWPGLANTRFANQIDAAVEVIGTKQVWFFSGDQYARYDTENEQITIGPKSISEGWPGLRPDFTTDLDAAVTRGSDNEVWLFKRNRCIKYDRDNNTILAGPNAITEGWSGLAGTRFAKHIDSAVEKSGTNDVWLFSGNQYVRYNTSTNQIASGPRSIHDGWPGLQNTPFTHGIDAAVPTNAANEVWFFSGDQYVHYNTETDRILYGIKSIGERWQGLKGTPYSWGMDTAVGIPKGNSSQDKVWFFVGNRCVRYNTTADRFDADEQWIDAAWPATATAPAGHPHDEL